MGEKILLQSMIDYVHDMMSQAKEYKDSSATDEYDRAYCDGSINTCKAALEALRKLQKGGS